MASALTAIRNYCKACIGGAAKNCQMDGIADKLLIPVEPLLTQIGPRFAKNYPLPKGSCPLWPFRSSAVPTRSGREGQKSMEGGVDARKKGGHVLQSVQAVRLNCLWCMGGSTSEVKWCAATECALHSWRFGRKLRKGDPQKIPATDLSAQECEKKAGRPKIAALEGKGL